MVDLQDDSVTIEKLSKVKQKPYRNSREVARELGAVKYIECSALTQKGLKNISVEATLI